MKGNRVAHVNTDGARPSRYKATSAKPVTKLAKPRAGGISVVAGKYEGSPLHSPNENWLLDVHKLEPPRKQCPTQTNWLGL